MRWKGGKRRYNPQATHKPQRRSVCMECIRIADDGREVPSRKAVFATEEDAKAELLECQIKNVVYQEPWRREQRVYPCPSGNGTYHLTAQSEEFYNSQRSA